MKTNYNYLASSQGTNPTQEMGILQSLFDVKGSQTASLIMTVGLFLLLLFQTNYSYSSSISLKAVCNNDVLVKSESKVNTVVLCFNGLLTEEVNIRSTNSSNTEIFDSSSMQIMLTWYRDSDGDGYGNPSISTQSPTAPSGYVGNSSDCDDSNPLVWRLGTFFIDNDGDGYNNGSATLCYGANVPIGYARGTSGRDCDDNNANIYRSGMLFVDSDNDGYTNGLQMVCYGASIPVGYSLTSLGNDCNDNDLNIFQSAALFVDSDSDGYTVGLASIVCFGASIPVGFSVISLGIDCNDNDASVFQSSTVFIDEDEDGFHGLSIDNYCYGSTLPANYSTTTLGIDCDDNNAAINPYAIEIPNNGIDENCNGMQDDRVVTGITTTVVPSQCGAILARIYLSVFAVTGVPNVTMYTFEITDPNNMVQTLSSNNAWFQLTNLASHEYNTAYSIRVGLHINGIWQGFGAACTVTTPSLGNALTLNQCGTTINIYSPINAAVVFGATGYKFRITNVSNPGGPNGIMETERTQPWFHLTSLPSYEYGTTYSVQVAIKTTGAYSEFGPACDITTISLSSYSLTIKQCGVTYTNIYSPINANIIPNVSGYRFRVTNLTTLVSQEIIPAQSWINLSQLSMYSANTNYSVEVAVKTSGDFGAYGPACTISSPTATANRTMATAKVKIIAYPNPFSETFALDITRGAEGLVAVQVYDMIGKLLEVRSVEASDVSTLALGDRFPAGVYNVVVTHEKNVQTLRVIKR